MTNTWTYRAGTHRAGASLDGFDFEAVDGRIGTVDEHSADSGAGYLLVDTGFWIFGKKRIIPAGVVTDIDYENEAVYVTMTKDEVKNAPDVDEATDRTRDTWYRDTSGTYYDPFAW
jgi:hypothetical protein